MSLLRPWFTHPALLGLLALLPVLGALAALAGRRRRLALARLGNPSALEGLATPPGRLRLLQTLLQVGTLGLLLVGSAGPRWGHGGEQAAAPGRDLVAVLDASRSMSAQDVLPSRFDRARQALGELSRALEQRGGHRLGLVAFAGRARVVCPLTHDYDHFRAAVAELDATDPPGELRPLDETAVSGTRIGAALQAAVEAHDPEGRGYQDILLLSDGDDPARDGEWREGAAAARLQGIPVHVVGIGDPDRDSAVPLSGDAALRHGGDPVRTRLEEPVLEEIARMTRGTYTPARTQALPLARLFHEHIEPLAARDPGADALPVLRQRYPWFFGAALLCLAAEMLLGPLSVRQASPGRSVPA